MSTHLGQGTAHSKASADQFAHVTTGDDPTSWSLFARGYVDGARAILRASTAIDATALVVLQNLRHAIELFLKQIAKEMIEEHPQFCKTEGLSRNFHGHVLAALLLKIRPLLVAILEDEAEHACHANFDRSGWLTEFELLVAQVDAIDPDGHTIRYPAKRNGDASLDGATLVNLTELETLITRVQTCIDQYEYRCT